MSLQWKPYTATGPNVRKKSIAGDILDNGRQENRSYFGATSKIGNEFDLKALNRTVKAVKQVERRTGKNIPVIVSVKAKSSFIPKEFEKKVDAILVGYSINDRVFIETALGQHNPQGRLPLTSPKNMNAVEKQKEDVGEDMKPYVDSRGNVYKFGFGLNWYGKIRGKHQHR